MLTPLSIIFATISVICGMLMYYNMRHAIDLKHLREEINSVTFLIDAQTASIESKQNELEIRNSIRKITELRLAPLKKSLEDLRAADHLMHCTDSWSMLSKRKTSQISAQRVNYADKYLGASVESSDFVPITPWYSSFFYQYPHGAQNILHANMKPGACFAFKGAEANVQIRLSQAIYIEALEIQHISKYESPSKELSSAPRRFSIYGFDSFGLRFHLGDYEFDSLTPYQVFTVNADKVCQRILVVFRTNHGNPHYTCVYRVAVYGRPRQ